MLQSDITLNTRQYQRFYSADEFSTPEHSRLLHLSPISSELLILLTSLFFSLFSNRQLWAAVLKGRDLSQTDDWMFVACFFAVVTCVHALLLGLILIRRLTKPLLAVVLIVTALAAYYMQRYTVFFDTDMVRNVLRTDVKEATELLSLNMLWHVLLFGLLPALLVSLVPLKRVPWRRALFRRTVFLAAMAIIAVAAALSVFQEFSALMRNQKEIRYLITPGNYLVGVVRVLAQDTGHASKERKPVGVDAKLGATWNQREKPALFVLVVGETVRAQNWGLNGYARQTTPKLAQRQDVLNFPHVNACGTNTEVSLPCMFSPFGRHNYNEKAIRSHESLLHVLERAGIKTVWRDNQSGCKGVCTGLEQQRLDDSKHATLCNQDRCLDGILLEDLDKEIAKVNGNLVLVLHQLGNHGPAYFSRYPAEFRQFTPTCDTADLGKCSREEIVNAYDNAVLYTDHLLDQLIGFLSQQQTHDAAMLYVSDHGESLGENGIYLHGLPYAIAPKVQTSVPMTIWLSENFARSFDIDQGCLRRQTAQELSHDNLFHTILGLLQVETQVYDRKLDFTAACRSQIAP